jgi:SAM-dependent methyltransferase
MAELLSATRSSYDRVADEYAARLYDELAQKPFDRELLDRLVARVGNLGPICDLGCGPGQIARYLSERGASACGIDLSPAMVAEAARRNPGLTFSEGNILDLAAVADAAFCGVAAFYSLIHIEPGQIVEALREIRRVLRPGGSLLLAFHVGQEVRHLDEWWGRAVSLDFHFFEVEFMLKALDSAGLGQTEVFERGPYESVEVATQRAYIFATRDDERR